MHTLYLEQVGSPGGMITNVVVGEEACVHREEMARHGVHYLEGTNF
jgi:hypothetical protein